MAFVDIDGATMIKWVLQCQKYYVGVLIKLIEKVYYVRTSALITRSSSMQKVNGQARNCRQAKQDDTWTPAAVLRLIEKTCVVVYIMLSTNQDGFLSNKSTSTALFNYLKRIYTVEEIIIKAMSNLNVAVKYLPKLRYVG